MDLDVRAIPHPLGSAPGGALQYEAAADVQELVELAEEAQLLGVVVENAGAPDQVERSKPGVLLAWHVHEVLLDVPVRAGDLRAPVVYRRPLFGKVDHDELVGLQ